MNALFSDAHRRVRRTILDGNWFILFAIAFCLALQLQLQFVQKVNWDEFYFLSLIYEYQRGELAKPLQTLHVHLFGWLTAVGKDEIQQIEIARFCMWLFQIGTLLLIYFTSRLFCSSCASLLGVLCFICSGYALVHGTSFRADPMAAFFSMLCVYLLAGSKLSYKSLFLMGAAAAIAIHITVKVVLFLPLFIWLGFWQLSQFSYPFEAVKRLSIAALVCLVLGLAIYYYQLQNMPVHASNYSASVVSSAPSTVFLESGFLPRWHFIKESAALSMPQLLLFFVGIGMCLSQLIQSRPLRANALVLFGMLLPLGSFLFYRNAFPYYFPFIFPPSVCVIAYGASLIQNRNYLVIALVLALVGNHLVNYFDRTSEDQESQQEVISFLHEAFPKGTSYIDRCSMYGSNKKYGYFMSSWGHAAYRKNALPVIRDQALKNVVPVVVTNSSMLKHALKVGAASTYSSLLNADAEFLKNNYIPHWGNVWVAGVELSVSKDESVFRIGLPGLYTVESEFPVTIDEKVYVNRDTIVLDDEPKNIVSDSRQMVVLRWGDGLYMPSNEPSGKHVFSRF